MRCLPMGRLTLDFWRQLLMIPVIVWHRGDNSEIDELIKRRSRSFVRHVSRARESPVLMPCSSSVAIASMSNTSSLDSRA